MRALVAYMVTGGGAGVEGRGWQIVGKSKEEKRVASSERPDISGVRGENKLGKMSEPIEWIVMFKVKGQKPGEGGFRTLNPLDLDNCSGRYGISGEYLSNQQLSIDKKLFEEAKEVGKLLVKGESFLPKGSQGPNRVIYGVYAGLSEKESQDNIKGASVAHGFRFNPEEGGNKELPVLLTFADGVECMLEAWHIA